MKKKGLKRAVSLLLSFVTAASLVGCNGSQEVGAKAIDKDHVYACQELELPVRLDDIRGIFYANDRVYMTGVAYEGTTKMYLCSINPDGTDAKSIEIKTGFEVPEQEFPVGEVTIPEEDVPTAGEDSEEGVEAEPLPDRPTPRDLDVPTENVSIWFNTSVMDASGNLIGAVEVYRDYQNEKGEYISTDKMYLMKWDQDGQLQWSVDLSEGRPEGEYFYVGNVFCDEENVIWLLGQNTVMAFDEQGNKKAEKPLPEDMSGSMYMDKKGELFVTGWNADYTKRFAKTYDKKTMEIGKEMEIPEIIFNYSMMPGGGQFDFILNDSNAIYGYNIGDAEPVKIMDLIDSDLNTYGFNQVGMIDKEHFVASYNDSADWSIKLSLFTKVPPEEVKDKTPITMACMYLNGNVKSRIIEFNKTNPMYRIQIKEYNKYSTMEDYMGGYTQLNNDIVAGKIPDMLLVDSSMPLDSYISKGLLADLYPLLEQDPELNREDYLQNIFDAFSVDGKMYRLVTSFNVSTVLGKTSLVGDRKGWNMKEFEELMATMPEGTLSFSFMTRDSMMYTGMMMTRGEYIDSESGKCSFDSQGFIDFLNFVKQFPAQNPDGGIALDYSWEDEQVAYRENRTILMNRYLSTYADFNRVEKGEFGEDVTIIGFPTEGKNGNAILPSLSFAVFGKSKHIDGAWEFIRQYLMDDYQENLSYEFPVKKSALAIQEQEAMERPYWEDAEGNREYYDDSYYLNGVEVIIDPMTAQEAKEFTEFLSGLTLVGEYDQKLVDIINEEAAPFFEGQKTAEEAAKIIQSRVQLYISESR